MSENEVKGLKKKVKSTSLDANILSFDEAISASQLFLTFAAQEGIQVERETLDILVKAKHILQEDQLTPEFETEFWLAFNKITNLVQPVTIHSLISSMGTYDFSGSKTPKARPLKARKAVYRYGFIAVVALILLIVFQTYWMIGTAVINDLNRDFVKRGEVNAEIEKIKELKGYNETEPIDDAEYIQMLNTSEEYLTKLNANTKFLFNWNRIWQAMLFIGQFSGDLTEYQEFKFKQTSQQLEANLKAALEDETSGSAVDSVATIKDTDVIAEWKNKIAKLKLDHQHEKAGNKVQESINAAIFALQIMQVFFLPLCYGLLGAVTFILRRLVIEIKTQTYSSESDINFYLKLALGALAGMTIGWFVVPDEGSLGSLSPFALAFLVGYNVEILFSLMDKIIANFSKEGPTPPKPAEEK